MPLKEANDVFLQLPGGANQVWKQSEIATSEFVQKEW